MRACVIVFGQAVKSLLHWWPSYCVNLFYRDPPCSYRNYSSLLLKKLLNQFCYVNVTDIAQNSLLSHKTSFRWRRINISSGIGFHQPAEKVAKPPPDCWQSMCSSLLSSSLPNGCWQPLSNAPTWCFERSCERQQALLLIVQQRRVL